MKSQIDHHRNSADVILPCILCNQAWSGWVHQEHDHVCNFRLCKGELHLSRVCQYQAGDRQGFRQEQSSIYNFNGVSRLGIHQS